MINCEHKLGWEAHFDHDRSSTRSDACGIHDESDPSPIGDLDAQELKEKAASWSAQIVAAHVAGAGGLFTALQTGLKLTPTLRLVNALLGLGQAGQDRTQIVADTRVAYDPSRGSPSRDRPAHRTKENSVASRDHRTKAHFAVGDALVSFGDLVERVGFGHYFDFARRGDL